MVQLSEEIILFTLQVTLLILHFLWTVNSLQMLITKGNHALEIPRPLTLLAIRRQTTHLTLIPGLSRHFGNH